MQESDAISQIGKTKLTDKEAICAEGEEKVWKKQKLEKDDEEDDKADDDSVEFVQSSFPSASGKALPAMEGNDDDDDSVEFLQSSFPSASAKAFAKLMHCFP